MSLTRTINMRPTLISLLLTALLFASLSALHAAEPPINVLLITARTRDAAVTLAEYIEKISGQKSSATFCSFVLPL